MSRERLNQGYALVIPGILGEQVWDRNVARSIADSQFPGAVEIHDGTKGPLMMGVNMAGNQCETCRIARKIVDYTRHYPGRPVYLVGHSVGGNMAVRALEALPHGVQVEKAILLAPGLASHYDLRHSMQHSRSGIVAYSSPIDAPVSVPLAAIHGLSRGELCLPAAVIGFTTPQGLTAAERADYQRQLRQRRYSLAMLKSGHTGGHWGWTSPQFVTKYVTQELTPPEKSLVSQPASVVLTSGLANH
ncbi:MAG: alpha/beta hydrolase [Pirellulaceae bacterium]